MSEESSLYLELTELSKKRPVLTDLVENFPKSENISRTWLELYYASSIKYGTKSQVLRAALGGGLESFDSEVFITSGAARRVCQYFLYNPTFSFSMTSVLPSPIKDNIPSYFVRLTGVRRASPQQFLLGFLEILEKLPTELDPKLRELMDSLWATNLLDEESIEAWLSDRSEKMKQRIAAFFLPNLKQQQAVNTCRMMKSLTDPLRRHGKLQDKIPVQMSKYLGLDKGALTQLEVAMDCSSLILNGVVANEKVKGGSKIISFCEDLEKSGYQEELQWLKSKTLMSTADVMTTFGRRQNREHVGRHLTGLLFNTDRLASHEKFSKIFTPLYDAVVDDRLSKLLSNHFKRLNAQFATNVNVFLDAHAPSGIRIRDLYNIAFYTHYLVQQGVADVNDRERHYSKLLPSVAKFALGTPEPVSSNKLRSDKPKPSTFITSKGYRLQFYKELESLLAGATHQEQIKQLEMVKQELANNDSTATDKAINAINEAISVLSTQS